MLANIIIIHTILTLKILAKLLFLITMMRNASLYKKLILKFMGTYIIQRLN